jgi:prepilin-type N-terminal cleavage/methylation domain-containing protein
MISKKRITKRHKEDGFTLMEMIVAISLFVVVMLSATQIFRMIIEGQRSAIASQSIQENIRYFFEVMS